MICSYHMNKVLLEIFIFPTKRNKSIIVIVNNKSLDFKEMIMITKTDRPLKKFYGVQNRFHVGYALYNNI